MQDPCSDFQLALTVLLALEGVFVRPNYAEPYVINLISYLISINQLI